MQQHIIHAALVVHDYDDAIAFYTGKLKFRLIEDIAKDPNANDPDKTSGDQTSGDHRWVVVAPPGDSVMSLVLAKATNTEQRSRVGDQTGGRVFLFLSTDDFWRDYKRMVADGVKFIREPETQPYGTVAVFADLYGNQWDLIEPSQEHKFYGKLQ